MWTVLLQLLTSQESRQKARVPDLFYAHSEVDFEPWWTEAHTVTPPP